jgi:SAM-dependent methyltransferase
VISLSAQNWADYAPLIDDEKIGAAERGLLKLIPVDELKGRRFLDIGCGSGLSSLAAARLGVARHHLHGGFPAGQSRRPKKLSVVARHGLLSRRTRLARRLSL